MKSDDSRQDVRIRIIGAASGLGAQDQACEDGPVAFHRSQVWHELAHHPRIDWGRTLFPPDEGAPAGRIAVLCRHLANEVEQTLNAGEFPVVIGGDHSIAIGTWSGVAAQLGEPPGLLWIDAHLDSHTPETSYSGAIHGMPLACLLGRGDKRLLNIGRRGPQVSARHTAVLGPRSYEPEEIEFLQRMGVRIFFNDEIRQRLKPDTEIGVGEWVDVSGLIAPKSEIDRLLDGIENGTVNRLKSINASFAEMHENYYTYEWTWAYHKIQEFYGLNPETITAQDIIGIVKAWQQAVVGLDKMVYEDAKKEFSLSSMTGFGADGSHDEMKQDFEQVRGDFESNTFVTAVLKHIEDKTALGNELIKRIEAIES